MQYIESAKRVIMIEHQAISNLLARLDNGFSEACKLLRETQGRVVILGLGKSGHIGNKIAATLASTGTPSFAVNAGEASHGDFGMITKGDVVIAISNSGRTVEIIRLLPLLKKLAVPLISLTGNSDSELAQAAKVNLDVSVEHEACPLGLAPTASTTATLVMGDALAIALLEARDFTPTDFAFSHPGGNLGKRLLLTVEDLMHTGETIPKVAADANLHDTILVVSRKRLGMACIVDKQDKLLGIFTDGDMRRTFEKGLALDETCIRDVMMPSPQTTTPERSALEALDKMNADSISSLVVCNNNNQPIGIIHMHDILRAGVS